MALFVVPEKTPEGILGYAPAEPGQVPEEVPKYVGTAGLLEQGEQILAGLDDSWLDDGKAGFVATDRRFFVYKKQKLRFEVRYDEVRHAFFRRMWYPRTPLVGRGGVFGAGPVVVLRLRFDLAEGTRKKLRVSQYAGDVFPIVCVLMERLADRLELGKVLPGI